MDNRPPLLDLQVPVAANECGVVPWSAVPGLAFNISVNQPHHHLYWWALSYVRGLGIASGALDTDSNPSGLPVPVNKSVSAAPMTAGLSSTCAFALTPGAWPLVRNGFDLIHYAEVRRAIAVEKCS